jgi:PAS domain S-box-containing protein
VAVSLLSQIDALVVGIATVAIAVAFFAGLFTMRLLRSDAATMAALRESESRFRKLAEASFDGMLVSENGVILACNGKITDIFGYTVEELIGRHIATLVPESSRATTQRRLADAAEGFYEVELLRKDGRPGAIEVSAVHYEHKGRKFRVSAIRDISRRREAEALVHRSNERFRKLAEGTYDAVLVIEEGRVTSVYGGASVLYQCDAAQLIGIDPVDLVAPELRARAQARVEA